VLAEGGAPVVAGACAGGFEAGAAFDEVFAGQGLADEVEPVMSEGEDGKSHRFLFCLHAKALAFVSSHPGLRAGLGVALLQGGAAAGAG